MGPIEMFFSPVGIVLRGICRLLQQNRIPPPPPPARTNPGLAVALEGTLDLAHLDVVCGIR